MAITEALSSAMATRALSRRMKAAGADKIFMDNANFNSWKTKSQQSVGRSDVSSTREKGINRV